MSAEAKVWIPNIGYVPVSSASEKMKPAKKEGSKKRENAIKSLLKRIVEVMGTEKVYGLTGKVIKIEGKAIATQEGLKGGITVKTLMDKGYVGRVKVKGVLPKFFVVEAGMIYAEIPTTIAPVVESASAEAATTI